MKQKYRINIYVKCELADKGEIEHHLTGILHPDHNVYLVSQGLLHMSEVTCLPNDHTPESFEDVLYTAICAGAPHCESIVIKLDELDSELQDEIDALVYENKKMGDYLQKLGLTPCDITDYVINSTATDKSFDLGVMSDGYHTFDELYDFRREYNAALFNEWAAQGKYDAHKSKKHYDGQECFGGGYFIVVAVLPTGQISNHYAEEYWDSFQVEVVESAKYKYDGHSPTDVVNRLANLNKTVE